MSCGMSRKRHREAYCEADLKIQVNCMLGTHQPMATKNNYNKHHPTTSSTPTRTAVPPHRTPLTRQLAMATRRTLAGVTPLSRRKAEKTSLALPGTPDVYLSPVHQQLYQNEVGKENLYTSINTCNIRVDSCAKPMTRATPSNKMSFRGV